MEQARGNHDLKDPNMCTWNDPVAEPIPQQVFSHKIQFKDKPGTRLYLTFVGYECAALCFRLCAHTRSKHTSAYSISQGNRLQQLRQDGKANKK
jgi:hypothetical protein